MLKFFDVASGSGIHTEERNLLSAFVVRLGVGIGCGTTAFLKDLLKGFNPPAI